MSRTQVAATVIGAVIAMIGAVVAAKPESLGLSPVVANWLGIVLVGLGPISAALQSERVQQTFGLKHDGP